MRPIWSASNETASTPSVRRFAATTWAARRSPNERAKSCTRGVISSVYEMPYRRRDSFVQRASIASTATSPAGTPFERRRRCTRRISATNESISFSARGLLTAARSESVTLEIAETTRNRRVASSRIKAAIRRYMSGSLTQAPPNFASFANSVKVSPSVGHFGVQDAPSRTSAQGVVREDEEPQDPVRDADPTHRGGHAARPRWLTGPEIPQGLRAVLLRADDHGPLGGRRQLPALRFSPER